MSLSSLLLALLLDSWQVTAGQAAVDALPDIYRTVFIIRDVEGLSTEETAEALGISVPTVKTRLHRARIALRDAIGGYFKTGD